MCAFVLFVHVLVYCAFIMFGKLGINCIGYVIGVLLFVLMFVTFRFNGWPSCDVL